MRVVSLVPSATETLVALGVVPLACTRFCDVPGIPTVGGTKDPHVDEIVALAPDLVVVNDEENRLEDAERLSEAGLALHSMSPRTVADVGPAVVALAAAVGVDAPAPFTAWAGWLAGQESRPSPRRRAVTLVWRRPWMALGSDTYGSSVLALLGVANVLPGPERYPEVTLEALALHEPDLVVLPSEPYPFAERHVAGVAAGVPGAGVVLLDGRDLFWWGARTPGAVERLRSSLTGSSGAT